MYPSHVDPETKQKAKKALIKAFQTREGTIIAYEIAIRMIPQATNLQIPEHIGDTPTERSTIYYWTLANTLRAKTGSNS